MAKKPTGTRPAFLKLGTGNLDAYLTFAQTSTVEGFGDLAKKCLKEVRTVQTTLAQMSEVWRDRQESGGTGKLFKEGKGKSPQEEGH